MPPYTLTSNLNYNLESVLVIVLVVWVVVLSLAFYWMVRHYRRLVKGSDGGDLKKILDKIVDRQALTQREIVAMAKALEKLEKDALAHIQKIGITKFNPYNETGGAQSFSAAILDAHKTGILVTGLHGRDRTRVYIKPVKAGKSSYELSVEEKKAIEIAGSS